MDDIFGFEGLVESRPIQHFGDSDLTFNGLLTPGLKIHEDGGETGCGGKVWVAGELLCEFILEMSNNTGLLSKWAPQSSQFMNVLELGSGTGLVGLCVGLLSKNMFDQNIKTYITDIDHLVPLMEKNIDLNIVGTDVVAKELWWGEPLPIEFVPSSNASINTQNIDLILAADCVYLEKTFPLLEKTLLDLTEGTNPPMILMSYRKRRKADKHFFQKIKKNFDVITVREFEKYDIYLKQRTHLFKLIRHTK